MPCSPLPPLGRCPRFPLWPDNHREPEGVAADRPLVRVGLIYVDYLTNEYATSSKNHSLRTHRMHCFARKCNTITAYGNPFFLFLQGLQTLQAP